MITLLILIVLLAISIYLLGNWEYELLGSIIFSVSMLGLIIHSMFFFTAGYNYGLFVEKRNAFEQTLIEARKNGSDYETAAISKEVAQWNQQLAEYKYDNKHAFLGQYVDDRIESLKPIK